MGKLLDKLVSVGNSVKNFAGKLAIALLTVIVVMLLFALYFLIFNPIIFWVWAMIVPTSAANALRNVRDKGDDNPFSVPGEFYFGLNRRLVKPFLPWRVKKVFYRVFSFENTSLEEEIRYFIEERNKGKLLEKRLLSKKTLNEIWRRYGLDHVEILLPYMGVLTDEQMGSLIYHEKWHLIAKYIAKFTLSDSMLVKLTSKWVETGKNLGTNVNPRIGDMFDSLTALVSSYIKRNGLPSGLLNRLMTSELPLKVNDALENALLSYAEKQLLSKLNYSKVAWRVYCSMLDKGRDVLPENQKLMNLEQYEIYASLGKQLSWEAVAHFIIKWSQAPNEQNWQMLVKIFGDLQSKMCNAPENIDTLIVANPRLFSHLLVTYAKNKEKNA